MSCLDELLPQHHPRPVLQRLRQMTWPDALAPCQIRDGACQLQDAMVRPRRELELVHGGPRLGPDRLGRRRRIKELESKSPRLRELIQTTESLRKEHARLYFFQPAAQALSQQQFFAQGIQIHQVFIHLWELNPPHSFPIPLCRRTEQTRQISRKYSGSFALSARNGIVQR